jgi:3-hydroxyisobutyrate dehydrogenase-like beta-hydroxyacid dehydrogenase
VEAVGMIGLGLMGSALAERLLAGGRPVVGYDVRDSARDQLGASGGEPRVSVGEVFASARVVILSLPDSDVVRAVTDEARASVRGARIIDTTTGDPEATAALGQRLSDRGAQYLDATLTGSSDVARSGELVITAGGPIEAFRQSEPLFRLFAKEWFHVGPWGSGARAKLVVNLILGLNRAAMAEGLAFARRCGLDASAMLEVLRAGSAYSRVMDAKGRKMIDANFEPEARLALHLKDVRLIVASAQRTGAAVPFSHLHEQILTDLVARGLGEADNSVVIRAFDGPPGES